MPRVFGTALVQQFEEAGRLISDVNQRTVVFVAVLLYSLRDMKYSLPWIA